MFNVKNLFNSLRGTSENLSNDMLYEEKAVDTTQDATLKENTQAFDACIPSAVVNAGGEIITTNTSLENIFGVTFTNISEILDRESKDELTKTLHEIPLKFTQSLELKLNEKVDSKIILTYVTKTSEQEVHLYFIDITKYKKLEMHFIHSQKMEAIGQLAGGIAHDFNNLLTAMIGFCDLLLIKHPAGDPSFADIMQIKQNSNRAANLVRQLLTISRKQILNPKVLDLNIVISELASLLRRLIGQNIELKISHDRDLKKVKVDEGQLEQVIINLAVNARDAMLKKENKGTLSIITNNATISTQGGVPEGLVSLMSNDTIAPGNYALIEVIDTGTGIPKDMIHSIIEPFFTTKELGAGTGLGLAMVYGIIQQTGGYLYVDSKENVGTRFCIYLKAPSEYDDIEIEEVTKDAATQIIKKDLTGTATVLLVEDEDPVRTFGAHALSNKGYKVLEAEDGNEALQIMRDHGKDVDVIITDIMMPGINGPALINEIQKTYPNIKVIFMSGYTQETFADSYHVEGPINFLPKPFTLADLANKVKDVLEESKVPADM